MTGAGELTPCSFEDWYGRVHARIVAAVRLSVGHSDLACEAADEALVRAFERWNRVSVMASPEAWTARVALNVARRRLKRQAVEQALLRRHHRDADWRPEPVDTDLWSAVGDLSERQRTVVALRYVVDLKERDIAEVLRISRSTVSTTLRDAHARLHEVLTGNPPSQADEEIDNARPA